MVQCILHKWYLGSALESISLAKIGWTDAKDLNIDKGRSFYHEAHCTRGTNRRPTREIKVDLRVLLQDANPCQTTSAIRASTSTWVSLLFLSSSRRIIWYVGLHGSALKFTLVQLTRKREYQLAQWPISTLASGASGMEYTYAHT